MTEEKAKTLANKILSQVLEIHFSMSLEKIQEQFAFDLFLPRKVKDSITKEETWTDCQHRELFITTKNMELKDKSTGWMREKEIFTSIDAIINAWNEIDYMTTERVQDSINVEKSDTIYQCENVYHSTNCSDSKNIIFCDSCSNCEYTLASQRSVNSNYCIRVDDSINCSNCYNVIFSNKVSNSLFIQDCFNITNCMFCSHLAGKEYCIANMQYTKEEYLFYYDKILKWIVSD